MHEGKLPVTELWLAGKYEGDADHFPDLLFLGNDVASWRNPGSSGQESVRKIICKAVRVSGQDVGKEEASRLNKEPS